MTEQRKTFLTDLILGLLIAVSVIVFGLDSEQLLSHRLCDGTFIAGTILLCIGGLKFARNGGTFDMMAYGIVSAVQMTLPWLIKERKDADFAAYKERKQEGRKSPAPELWSGLIYLGLALIFLVIYLAQA